MAAKGFYLVQGDRTTCGGRITTGAEDHTLFDKPVAREQDSVSLSRGTEEKLSIVGRHDPCIVPRAAIVQTCAAALAVGDLLTAKYGMAWMEDPTGYRKEVL